MDALGFKCFSMHLEMNLDRGDNGGSELSTGKGLDLVCEGEGNGDRKTALRDGDGDEWVGE